MEIRPARGEGATCDLTDPNCGVPLNATFSVRFDRPILPSSANRQAVSVYAQAPPLWSPFFEPHYDVLERSVTLGVARLQPKLLYEYELIVPHAAGDPGFRGFDGGGLADGPIATQGFFVTSSAFAQPAPAPAFAEPTCTDIVRVLSSTCASACCHGDSNPVMGLDLASADGLKRSAIGRVAREADTGNQLAEPLVDPARFGVGMQIIEPGASFQSYLVYKLLIAHNLEPCSGADCPFDALPGATSCAPLSPDETRGLEDWFVVGAPMPTIVPDCADLPQKTHLDCGSMRALTRWIDGGAFCP